MNEDKKIEAIRLRVEERKSLKEIKKTLGISQSTASLWLRPYPLTADELAERKSRQGLITSARLRGKRKMLDGEESPLSRLASKNGLTPNQKGRVAEVAVLLRLTVRGFAVFRGVAEGEKADWMVTYKGGRPMKIQVKLAAKGKWGAPVVSVTYAHSKSGRKRYVDGDFDYLVGYDLHSDTAYVWSWEEMRERSSTISSTPSAREKWDKLQRG